MTMIDNALNTGPRFSELSDSAKAMVETIAARYCAASVQPQEDGTHYGEEKMRALHGIMKRDASAEGFEHTGGGVFLSYSIHRDAPSNAYVFVSASDESVRMYAVDSPACLRLAERMLGEMIGNIFNMRGEDDSVLIASVQPYADASDGRPRDAFKVYAAVGNIELAAAMLEDESRRIYREPLDDEQRDALRDGSQSFAMLDDMEARMGFRVADARAHVIAAHCLLGECAPDVARRVHELDLCHVYGRVMSDFGLDTFSSADEMTHGMRAMPDCSDWCARFIERWDNPHTGIAAPYASTCYACGESVARCNAAGECDACAPLDSIKKGS